MSEMRTNFYAGKEKGHIKRARIRRRLSEWRDKHRGLRLFCRLHWHRYGHWSKVKERIDHSGSILEQHVRYQDKHCGDCRIIKERTL